MIVVDSSVWINNLRNIKTPAVLKLRDMNRTSGILVGDVILLEVLQGARGEANAARIQRNMRQFSIVRMFNERLAVSAAAKYRRLRALGITVRKSNDLVIANFCIENGHDLLHDDRDFRPFTQHFGLRTVP